jgi:MFS transporter, DHA1 family, multidrug resistance protein
VTVAIAAPKPDSGGSRRARITLVVLLGWLSALAPLATDAYLPALPELSRDLGGSASVTLVTLTCSLLGLAVGQLVWGPLSDVYGRRRPLLVALCVYVAMSLACAAAPSIPPLYAFMLLQCCAGAAGIVIARAVARDLFAGVDLARFLGLIILVMGAAPVLGPVVGALVLKLSSWRGVFVTLAVLGAALTLSVAVALPETLPRARRRHGSGRATASSFALLLRDRSFVTYMLCIGFGFAAFGAWLAGSSFVLQDVYGVSAAQYSLVFGANALVLVTTAQIGRLVVARVGSERLLRLGVLLAATGGVAVFVVILLHGPLVALLPALGVFSAGQAGLLQQNAYALALHDHPRIAGTASALLGTTQFVAGAIVAPFVGIAGKHSAVPMGAVICVFSALNFAQYALVSLSRRRAGGPRAARLAPERRSTR